MTRYAIKAIFDTFQGEGHRAGARSVFVRFAGCNLWNGRPEDRDIGKGACARWCDTDFVRGTPMTADAIVAQVRAASGLSGGEWVVLTGGEPLLQVNTELLDTFTRAGWSVAIETNGTQPLPRSILPPYVTCSPKLGGKLVLSEASELKVVLPGGVGGNVWSLDALRSLQSQVVAEHYFVQPQDPVLPTAVEVSHLRGSRAPGWEVEYRRNVELCVDVARALGWRISAQSHKLLSLE